ncbi:NusG domain II-containing protein [Caloranaerobacter ferrireducens]|uniref:NusG domain II-containing protein n=1 Tax=Caloranaerobacter ferrireducens TaxID=1323370 RepID=UPI00084D4491|nr:NusG domain II-containing protein [Caloranaerobacter ferrireducens]
MTKWDKYLIFFIILLSIIGLSIVKSDISKSDYKYIRITVNGEVIKKITFGKNMIGKTIDIRTQYGYNKIEIGDGKVRVIDADCPDKLDVKQGWISKPGEIIVCLPHKLTIEIVGENKEDNKIDDVSY